MSTKVIDLAQHGWRRTPGMDRQHQVSSRLNSVITGMNGGFVDFCFWQGVSGERYVHHSYSLVGCPQLPPANYILFGRDDNGCRVALEIGRTSHDSASLNLAEIRHRGASLGAGEVHVHLMAGDDTERRRIESDLRAGLLPSAGNAKVTA